MARQLECVDIYQCSNFEIQINKSLSIMINCVFLADTDTYKGDKKIFF